MDEKEQVKKGIKCCLDTWDKAYCPEECPFHGKCYLGHELMQAAYEVLAKEDEVAPTIREGAEVEKVICCGSCGSSLYHLFPWKKISKAREYAQYCRHCGKKVKWDDWNGELLKEKHKIVRCKECKHARMTADGEICKYCELEEDENGFLREVCHDADWFCADGEVKQE